MGYQRGNQNTKVFHKLENSSNQIVLLLIQSQQTIAL